MDVGYFRFLSDESKQTKNIYFTYKRRSTVCTPHW